MKKKPRILRNNDRSLTITTENKTPKIGKREKIIINDGKKKEDFSFNSFNSYSFKSTIFSNSEWKKIEEPNFEFNLISNKKRNQDILETYRRKDLKANIIPLKENKLINKVINPKINEIYLCFDKLRMQTLNSLNLKLNQNNLKKLKETETNFIKKPKFNNTSLSKKFTSKAIFKSSHKEIHFELEHYFKKKTN